MFRALIPGTDFAPQTACRQPLPTGTARKQTAPQNHDNHQKTIHTHAFTGASRRIRRLRGVQFGRRRPRTAETLRLRHLHGGLHHARIEGRRNGLEKRAAALHLDQRHERRLAYAVCVSDGTVYAAGYERQGDRIVAKVWENGTLKYTPALPAPTRTPTRSSPQTAASTRPGARRAAEP